MATLTTAKTRQGLGGASINYTRPLTDKAESEAAPATTKHRPMLSSVGRGMGTM